ncbi:antibiotic biosynthesis monooxygenase [Frankia sp. AiPa1]|uniref:antibiotic biosynthesis monooxygenase family protein n=1 Tax=Frankia sp. AiPa1 TaxID=573492 RepID=UPI00202B40F3|nr:antibiotic biosynthesis monooxygenase [Frankia sp. AiPa1]
MLWAIDPPDQPGAVERAYHEISSRLVGTPGLLGNTLQRSAADPSCYAVVSVWSSMADFSVWEQGASHRGTTSPLRPLQDPERRPMILTEIAAYGPQGRFGPPPPA